MSKEPCPDCEEFAKMGRRMGKTDLVNERFWRHLRDDHGFDVSPPFLSCAHGPEWLCPSCVAGVS